MEGVAGRADPGDLLHFWLSLCEFTATDRNLRAEDRTDPFWAAKIDGQFEFSFREGR